MITAAVIAAAVVAILIFFPTIRRIVRIVVTLLITLCTSAIAICGLAILMNNVSINDQPGILPRIYRFLTVDWAATSAKGSGSATCKDAALTETASSTEGTGASARHRHADQGVQAGQPTASPSPGANPEEDVYPELVRRGYPGLSRAKLFALTKETVGELGGWKVVKEEPRAYTLECTYTSRVLNLEDQIKIVVTPRSEIDLCSQSGAGDSGGRVWKWFFTGDFAANIGHIKEFYLALEPRIDQAYKEQERKQGDAG
jgi:hypothetical protein